MSELKTEEEKAADQRRGPAAARRGGPPHLQIGVPTEKSQNFVPSAKRVLGLLHPERFIVWTVVALAVASVVLSAIGPKILGGATDLIFAGVFGKQIPAGVTQVQAAEALRTKGQDSLADMLAAMDHVVPGQGIDFTALAKVLMFVMASYPVGLQVYWIASNFLAILQQRVLYARHPDLKTAPAK
jgi:ATP-binding cassette subfamily B protein